MAIFSQALKSPRAIAEAAATPPTTGRARLNITSIGERKMISYVGDDSDDTDHAALQMQQRAKKMMLRVYPRNTRFDSSNLQPLTFWRVGAQMVALNMQTNDIATQLHHALFSHCGYVLKPENLRTGELGWPAARPMLKCFTLRVLSLHHLPARREGRPLLESGSRAQCHGYVKDLSGKHAPPEAGGASSPAITVELLPIGGFAQARVLLLWWWPPIASCREVATAG